MRQTAFLRALAALLATSLASMALPAHSQQAQREQAGNGNPAPPSYGPVLNRRPPQAADPVRKDPAEVRDETDHLAREGSPPSAPQSPRQSQQPRQPQRSRHAWQPADPPAPRSSRSVDAQPIGTGAVPIPPPAQAPQPVVPSSRALNCVGGACTDASGGSYNLGPTGVGVSSSGRLCSTSGTTVQCF